MGNVKHSITLYGFGNKYVRGLYTFEEILAKAKNLGGDGIEIVAPQMVPGHPNPSEDWIAYFKGCCVKYDLTPVCYSVYIDSGKHKGRFLNETERMTCTINEMEVAKKLGFKIVRSQDALLPSTMEKVLPYVEELGMHLAIELHGPWCPTTPVFEQYYELFERKQTQSLGIVPDYSAFASGAPATALNVFPDDVCHKDLLDEFRVLYTTTEIPVEELIAKMYEKGGDEVDEMIARGRLMGVPVGSKMGTIYYRTKPDYDGFRRFLKYSKYMHGKFWYVDEDLNCPGIDYPTYVKIMKEEGYDGFVASEYEGGGFDNTLDDEDQISRHIRMLEKLWAEA